MGIREFVIDRAERAGIEKGLEQGIEQGISIGMSKKEYEKNHNFATSLIRGTDFDDEKIAELTGVSPKFVSDLRLKLNV